MLLDAGVEPDVDSTPEKFRRSLDDDIAHWAPVINTMGFKID
jgi:tripartite-type tricarboxylate transporter receptor subunit TctC